MKKCWKCEQIKEVEEFSKCRRNKDGRQDACRECDNEIKRQWRKKNKQYAAEYNRKWQEENRDKGNEKAKRYRERHPERVINNKERYKEANHDEVLASSRRWKEKNPDRVKMMQRPCWFVEKAIKSGDLVRPSKCEGCGKTGMAEAAHYSYEQGRELDVRWLCRSCHIRWDQNEPKSFIAEV